MVHTEKEWEKIYKHGCDLITERDATIATLTAELATLAEKYQALDRMFTHAGLVKAQEVHNQMIAERDGTIDDLRERMAALEGELLGAQDATIAAFRTTIAGLCEELAKCSPKTK